MADDVDVPKVGPVDKRVVAAIVVAGGGFVAYRYWAASRTSAESGDTVPAETSEFDDSGDPGTVLGAIRPDNGYGIPEDDSTEPASTDDFGFRGTTNDAWTQYAIVQLTQSDRWSYTDIVEALGAYLSQRPTTKAQQSIISAASAVAGAPPIGGARPLINAPEPVTPITPAPVTPAAQAPVAVPTGLKVTAFTATTATIAWNAVAGATSYEVDIKPGALASVKPHEKKFTGLKGKTQYQFRVRTVSGSRFSQWSPFVSVKTK